MAHAPRVDAVSSPGDKHRDESRRGTHECVRHMAAPICDAIHVHPLIVPDEPSHVTGPFLKYDSLAI